MFEKIIYPFFINVYHSALHLAALWNPKAREWVNGRVAQKDRIRNFEPGAQTIWMHCASLGEFEQGRPVLEALMLKEPTAKIVLSFFSPSGYTAIKNYKQADLIIYLPIDKKSEVKKLLQSIKPTLIIWVKYEYWFTYIREIYNQKIPLLLIAAHFREDQPFFKFYGKSWRRMLKRFTQIFVQESADKTLLSSININKVEVTGDTRFDRVLGLIKSPQEIPEQVKNFAGSAQILVAGSTWPEDEFQLIHFTKTHPQIKCVIVPHETDVESVKEVQEKFPQAALFSTLSSQDYGKQILIVDTVGLLSSLYSIATITYVGGGFNESGIHNILEPAVWGKPVIFGPIYEKFVEANEMLEKGFAFTSSTPVILETIFARILDQISKKGFWEPGVVAYINEKSGATEKVIDYIYKNRLLTK